MAQPQTIAARGVHDAQRTARNAATSPGATMLARCGLATKGVVYIIVGVLAAQVALHRGGATKDDVGAIQFVYNQPGGKILLALVAVGLLAYALFDIAKGWLDLEQKGTEPKGIVERVGYAVAGLTYGVLAWGAFQLVMGRGSGGKTTDATAHDRTAQALQLPFGSALVVVGGLVFLGVAAAQFAQAFTASFQKQLRLTSLAAHEQGLIVFIGRFGLAARGVVFAIIGFFLILAALRQNPAEAKGMAGALQELLNHPYGHVLLGVVAFGFVAFGAYSCVEARFRTL